jgi:hypothetical protein
MLVYIRVSVVLIWQYSRKESHKLDISLDSTVFVLRVYRQIVRLYFFKVYQNQLGLSGMFECHTLGLE